MKRTIMYILPLVLILSGCRMRTVSYEVDRVDQELEGNRGVLYGDASKAPVPERKKTRKVYDLEIELFSKFDFEGKEKRVEAKRTIDKDINGNQGYIQGSKKGTALKPLPRKKDVVRFGGVKSPRLTSKKTRKTKDDAVKKKGSGTIVTSEQEDIVYIVKKGDTLQKISGEVYGTTRKWKKIYEANKDVLKSPDHIKPNQKLVIPAK